MDVSCKCDRDLIGILFNIHFNSDILELIEMSDGDLYNSKLDLFIESPYSLVSGTNIRIGTNLSNPITIKNKKKCTLSFF